MAKQISIEELTKLAVQGDAAAIRKLADMYFYGEGVEEDNEKAIELYLKLADQNDSEVNRRIGVCYSCLEDYEKAVEWYLKAAEQGNDEAQCNLGTCYYSGEGVEEDTEKAIEWYLKSAEQGNADAQRYLGDIYDEEEDYESAIKWYTKAAEQGNDEAQSCLGIFYFQGKGVEKNLEEAVKWYTKAAEQGNAVAQFNLANRYSFGGGVEQDEETAVKWYTKAAEQGIPNAMCSLGYHYLEGKGGTIDLAKAVEWFTKAAEEGYAKAQYELGICYYNGDGVKKDLVKAAKWWHLAAEQGHQKAQESYDKLTGNSGKVEEEDEQEEDEQEDSTAPGWDAITAEFERLYPGQTKPKHYGTVIPWSLGGNDPLAGISVYDAGDYWHFVTYGLTDLYEKESDDEEWSGYGYEMTLKLKKYDFEDEESEIRCVCGILQSIARITFKGNEIFRPYEYIYTGQKAGVDVKQESNLTGFICVPDSSAQTIHTPNGKVEFLQLIGMTDAELLTLKSGKSVEDIYKKLGSDLTDYHRDSIV